MRRWIVGLMVLLLWGGWQGVSADPPRPEGARAPAQVPVACRTLPPDALYLDPRLEGLRVHTHEAATCEGGCWRLRSVCYQDDVESAGLHHVWVRLVDEQGNQVGGLPWHLGYASGQSDAVSKPAPDWSDIAMYGPDGCFNPDQVSGPYFAFAGDDPARSDQVRGLGLPLCHHVNYWLTWQRVPATTPTATPSPTESATPTATPSLTASPTATPVGVLYLPVVLRRAPLASQPPATLTPSPTPSPTESPTLTPTMGQTATLTPTIPIPTATATATPSTLFVSRFEGWEPNCSGTQVKGRVFDVQGSPLAGVRVRVLLFGIQHGGLLQTDANGFYEFNRFGTSDPLLEIDYLVAVVSEDGSTLQSDEVYVRSQSAPCAPGSGGRQVATIDFWRGE